MVKLGFFFDRFSQGKFGMMDSDYGRPTRSKGLLPSGLDASAVLDLPPTPGAPHDSLGAAVVGGGLDDDGFGGAMSTDIMSGGLFEGGIFDDVPMDVGNPPEPLDDTLIAQPGPSTSGEDRQETAPEQRAADDNRFDLDA
jgi:hypothetical protein